MGFAGVRHRVKRTRWGADTEELDASGSKVESDTGTDANLVLGSGPSQDFSTRDNANGLKPLKKRRTRWGDDEGQESSETDLKVGLGILYNPVQMHRLFPIPCLSQEQWILSILNNMFLCAFY